MGPVPYPWSKSRTTGHYLRLDNTNLRRILLGVTKIKRTSCKQYVFRIPMNSKKKENRNRLFVTNSSPGVKPIHKED